MTAARLLPPPPHPDDVAALAARTRPLEPDLAAAVGPLAPLFARAEVTEVMINGPGPVWVEAAGTLAATDIVLDRAAIDHLAERLVSPLGRRVDRMSPLVDARLPDGSRVHVVAPPLAVDGPYITVRRFRPAGVALDAMASPAVARLLRWAVAARLNIVVSGGTSSGKTTLLNALATQIGSGDRIVTIEDAAELAIASPHVVRLETRPPSVDGPAPVPIRELVRNSLRMRPDRIVVGEVRGAEALDMLQAMNTGHEGTLSTCHANGPADALSRLEVMVLMGATGLPLSAVRRLIGRAVDLVVHMHRCADGDRRVVEIAETQPDQGVRTLSDGVAVGQPPRRCRRPDCPPFDPGSDP